MIDFITNPAIIWVISVMIGSVAYFISYHYFKSKLKTKDLLVDTLIPISNQKEFSNFDYEDLKTMTDIEYDNGKFYYTELGYIRDKIVKEFPLNLNMKNNLQYKDDFCQVRIDNLPKKAKSIYITFEILYKNENENENQRHNDIKLNSIGYIQVETSSNTIINLENEKSEIDILHIKDKHPLICFRLVIDLKLDEELKQKDFFLSIKAKWFKI